MKVGFLIKIFFLSLLFFSCVSEKSNKKLPTAEDSTEERTETSIPGVWSEWKDYSECDKISKTKIQIRFCSGGTCSGDAKRIVACGEVGGWSDFIGTGICDVTTGMEKYVRTCTEPAPTPGGVPCSGDSYEYRTCPVNGAYSDFRRLTNYCDPDTKQYVFVRYCDNPAPKNGGTCPGVSPDYKYEACVPEVVNKPWYINTCVDCEPKDAVYGDWVLASACINGKMKYVRDCIEGPINGGAPCEAEPLSKLDECTIPHTWDTRIVDNCAGDGTRTEVKTCVAGSGPEGGCPDPAEIRTTLPCPVDCVYGNWELADGRTCEYPGYGYMVRSPIVEGANGGILCDTNLMQEYRRCPMSGESDCQNPYSSNFRCSLDESTCP